MPLSSAYLEERGAYLLDNGRVFVVWLGRALDPQWGRQVGVGVCVKCAYVCAVGAYPLGGR
jgi:hypothetical protein